MTLEFVHGFKTFSTDLTPSSNWFFDPSRLIRKSICQQVQNDLYLVAHGSKDGKADPAVLSLVRDLQRLRGGNVQLEILTANEPPKPSGNIVWLIPLLLLPGHHVRKDMPQIRHRFLEQGIQSKSLPFLGSWNLCLLTLQNVIQTELKFGKPILMHHPIKNGLEKSFFDVLQKKLKIPIFAWNDSDQLALKHRINYRILSFTLTSNQNTKVMSRTQAMSSFLDLDLFRMQLIDMLRLLP